MTEVYTELLETWWSPPNPQTGLCFSCFWANHTSGLQAKQLGQQKSSPWMASFGFFLTQELLEELLHFQKALGYPPTAVK